MFNIVGMALRLVEKAVGFVAIKSEKNPKQATGWAGLGIALLGVAGIDVGTINSAGNNISLLGTWLSGVQ